MPTPETTGATDVKGGAAAIRSLMEPPKDEETTSEESPEIEAEAEPIEENEDEDEVEQSPEFAIPDDANITVKVDGKSVQVSGKELRAGYSRQQDYTKKTQDVAESRKQAESERTAAQQERAQLQSALKQMHDTMTAQAPERPDPKLYEANPSEFAYQSEMFRRHQEELQQVQLAQAELTRRQTEDQSKALREQLREGQQRLQEKIPSWTDPKVAATEKAQLAQFAKDELGYTDDELAQVTDSRAVLALHKAWRGHLLATSTVPAPTSKKQTTPTVKPGGPTEGSSSKARNAMARLQQSGKTTDAADALRHLGVI